LGLATPLAITAAVGSSSQHGILVRDSSVLEKVRQLDVVAFDKTGTVTEGNFELLQTGLVNRNTDFDRDYLPLIAALEHFSEHPLGDALIRYAAARKIELVEARQVEILKGLGISGRVDGQHWFAGNQRLAAQQCPSLPRGLAEIAREWEQNGKTVVFFGRDNEVLGLLSFGDRIKPDAAEMITRLKERNIRTILISGDSVATTQAVADAIGVDEFRAETLPVDKTNAIHAFQQAGLKVAMIGDGINDAPALAQADLGIALGSGTDIAMNAADIVLMGDSLGRVLTIFELSGQTFRVVRQNLFWAFFYNTLGMSLAVTGILNPIMAAGAMLLSSLSVIANSMRLNIKRR